ncbi:hypothetical protein IWQ61_007552 [Dispira simplex]|nr:hypothetical protein IWQ61_007552 [Dispira simplex]
MSRPTRNTEARHLRHAPSEQDKLRQAIPQPVQPWDKQWVSPTGALPRKGGPRVFKWVKSNRSLEFYRPYTFAKNVTLSPSAEEALHPAEHQHTPQLTVGDIPIPAPRPTSDTVTSEPEPELEPASQAQQPATASEDQLTSTPPFTAVNIDGEVTKVKHEIPNDESHPSPSVQVDHSVTQDEPIVAEQSASPASHPGNQDAAQSQEGELAPMDTDQQNPF